MSTIDEEIENDPEFQEWKKDVEENLVPAMRKSAICVSLAPSGDTDAKFAVELGMMIMLEKPIVLVIEPGQYVPAKLRLIADEIVEADWRNDPTSAQVLMMEAMDRLVEDDS